MNAVSQPDYEQPSIWGGRCSIAQAVELINHWPGLEGLRYRIWETFSAAKMELRPEAPLQAADLQPLTRARLFGPGGDLSLRRHGSTFRWWFIGPPGVEPPSLPPELGDLAGFEAPQNFWEREPQAVFSCQTRRALLWGELRGAGDPDSRFWFEDRLARAELRYPVSSDCARVQIVYRVYQRAGRDEFVRLEAIEEGEGQHGNR